MNRPLSGGKSIWILLLLLIVWLGVFIRLPNISPYKFYPDSYQNLVVAKNITVYKSVAGALGENGMSYPPYFMWSRPVYPLFINLTNLIINDLTRSAQITAFLFGVLSIAGMYFLNLQIFKNKYAGLAGAFLAAISFNYTIWSGYIMSDTSGIFFLVLFLNSLIYILPKKSKLANASDIICGILFSLAVFSRYEYLILGIPAVFLLLIKKAGSEKLINLAVGFLLASSIILAALFPVAETITLVYEQSKDFLLIALSGILLFPFLYKYGVKIFYKFSNAIRIFFMVIAVFTLIQFFYTSVNPNFQLPLFVGLGNFLRSDPLISFFAFLGLALMINNPKQKVITLFLVVSVLIMEVIYFKLNPLQQRYHSHILVFLIVPAVQAIRHFLENSTKRKLFAYMIVGLLVLIVFQINATFNGIRNWHNGDWFNKSYEETSAISVKDTLNGREMIFAALPEAYFYFTNVPTRGISETYPYIYLGGLEANREVVIVRDMAMRDIFPGFSEYIDSHLQTFKKNSIKTSTNYRYRDYSEEETYPVEVYKLKVSNFPSPDN